MLSIKNVNAMGGTVLNVLRIHVDTLMLVNTMGGTVLNVLRIHVNILMHVKY